MGSIDIQEFGKRLAIEVLDRTDSEHKAPEFEPVVVTDGTDPFIALRAPAVDCGLGVEFCQDTDGVFHVQTFYGEACALTSVGAGGRKLNEDGVLKLDLADGRTVLAVSDGMGGHGGGDVATSIILHNAQSRMQSGESLAQALQEAGEALEGYYQGIGAVSPKLAAISANMGACVAAVEIDRSNYARFVHCGDARAVRFGPDGPLEITRDHSWLNQFVDEGNVIPNEAFRNEFRHIITRSLHLQHGRRQAVEIEQSKPFKVMPDDWIVLASDGLWDNVVEAEVFEILKVADGPLEALWELQELNKARVVDATGKDDNISIIVYRHSL